MVTRNQLDDPSASLFFTSEKAVFCKLICSASQCNELMWHGMLMLMLEEEQAQRLDPICEGPETNWTESSDSLLEKNEVKEAVREIYFIIGN